MSRLKPRAAASASSCSTARWAPCSRRRDLTAADFGGAELEGCNENLVLTRPDVIREHPRGLLRRRRGLRRDQHLRRRRRCVLAEYGLADRAPGDQRRAAARLAREAAARSRRTPRFVAGSMGPTTKTITVTGGVTFDELRASTSTCRRPGLHRGRRRLAPARDLPGHAQRQGGAARASTQALREAGRRASRSMVSGDHRADGHDARRPGRRGAATPRSSTLDPLSLGPQLRHRPRVHDRPPALARRAGAVLRRLRTRTPACPTRTASTTRRRQMLARALRRFVDEGWVNVVGGCCGTTPAHIAAHRRARSRGRRRARPAADRALTLVSGVDYVELDRRRCARSSWASAPT